MTALALSHSEVELQRGSILDVRVVEAAQVQVTLPVAVKLTSAALAFFVAGCNDGSFGALIPYMLRGYHISTGSVAILYGTAFAGWIVAALIGGFLRAYVGSGGALVLGAISQLLAQTMRVWVSLVNTS